MINEAYYIVAGRPVFKQRSQTTRFPRQQCARNHRGTVGNGVLYGGPCRGVIRTSGARTRGWNEATIQTGPEHGSRGIAIVRSRYEATTSEDTAD
jgi:hypothetical protein